jgi:TRAP-type C4-dicarboxylate transport system permease small subunit
MTKPAPRPSPASGRGSALARLESAAALLSRVFEQVAGLACLLCFGLVCYAVATRYFLNRPQAWTDEAVGWLVVVTVMLALPEAQRRGEHIGVDLLLEKSRPAARRVLSLVGLLFVLITGGMFVQQGIETVLFTRMVGIASNELPELPLWAIQALIPLGGVLLAVVALVQFAAWLSGREPAGIEHDKIEATE